MSQINLIEDLEKKRDNFFGVDEKTIPINIVIERAKNNDYHDFKSQLPMPKMMLFRDLKLIGLDDLAEKVFNGDYDELD